MDHKINMTKNTDWASHMNEKQLRHHINFLCSDLPKNKLIMIANYVYERKIHDGKRIEKDE
jgi:hypothetical protein